MGGGVATLRFTPVFSSPLRYLQELLIENVLKFSSKSLNNNEKVCLFVFLFFFYLASMCDNGCYLLLHFCTCRRSHVGCG